MEQNALIASAQSTEETLENVCLIVFFIILSPTEARAGYAASNDGYGMETQSDANVMYLSATALVKL